MSLACNPLVNCSCNIPVYAVQSNVYSGRYGFHIGFATQTSEGNDVNWTYSECLKKLYVRMSNIWPIGFRTVVQPPQGTIIRATPVYVEPEHKAEPVKRCPAHVMLKDFSYNNSVLLHLLRCQHKMADYVEDSCTGYLSVTAPFQQTEAGGDWLTLFYQFLCFSSCVGGINNRPLQVVFTLEYDGNVFGHQFVEVCIRACPGQDRTTDEKASIPMSKSQISKKGRADSYKNSVAAELPDEEFQLVIKGRKNYELLKRLRDAITS